VGVLILVVGAIDKVTIVVGPFLIISTVVSLLRQTGRLSENTEVPCLMIVVGLLALIARFLPLPMPRWLEEDTKTPKG